MGHELTQH